jgi:hypothetical protein
MPSYAYSSPIPSAKPDGIGDWWSERWLAYNVFVFIYSLLSIALLSLFSSRSPSPFSRNTGWPEPLAVLSRGPFPGFGMAIAFFLLEAQDGSLPGLMNNVNYDNSR